ncbi:MAG: DEAD/DEAH box helicase [Opitutaceae bacterium]|jgi:superfamily II DNA or RNA helicase|nr:DEAD/DEAH box helicase [Opitutaceae bacterium]
MTPVLRELQRRLSALDGERKRIAREIETLREREAAALALAATATAADDTENTGVMSAAEKVALFLGLFGARRSVYPRFWSNPKTGKKGYAPACDNEWRRGVCGKPRVKCAGCGQQRFPALDAAAAERHLRGKHTIGVYAIREDGGCVFLAADFDGEGWRAEVTAYRDAGRRCGVEVWVERSRSGKGAHAWIFFAEPVPAVLARRLGSVLLSLATAAHPTFGTGAYDRMFPNQDVLPPGGFGNLIALPLAKEPRAAGNCVFLDGRLEPERDQWAVLAKARDGRLSRERLDEVLARVGPMAEAQSGQGVPGATPTGGASGEEAQALVLESEEAVLDLSRPKITRGLLAGVVTVRLDSRVHVPRPLPPAVLAALRRLVTFPNPVYHEKLRLRFSTHGTPRFIFAGEWHADRLVLPRGTLDAALRILEAAGAEVVLQDARPEGARVTWKFGGGLRMAQERAVKALMEHEHGVLCAPPGAGKTVMGCALAARCKMATLVLVHRSVLLDQWRNEAMRFLGLKRREIGVWRGATRRLAGRFDIVMLPGVARMENYASLFSGYGLVIVDECHHVPAVSFEALMKACPVRRIVGLTATPARKDRLEKLLYLQCGPLRHVWSERDDIAGDDGGVRAPARIVRVRQTGFRMPQPQSSTAAALMPGKEPPLLHEVWDALTNDGARTRLIIADIRECLAEGRCPLVLSDRKLHLEKIAALLVADGVAVEWKSESDGAVGSVKATLFRLDGSVGKRVRDRMRADMETHFASGGRFVLLATASLVGEGFDLPRLDTLFLAMPLSFKGRLVQYAGRLHRAHELKREVRVYDYADDLPLTRAMFRRRSGAYREMGYRMMMDGEPGVTGASDTAAGQLGMGL